MASSALLLIGAPGSGKSSVLEALTTLLEVDGISYGAIESEQLAWGSPWLDDRQRAAILARVIAMQGAAGRRLFLVAATTESEHELEAIVEAVNADRTTVICLTAPPELVAQRIDRREPDAWPGKAALIDHARWLALTTPSTAGIDLVVETAKQSAVGVAAEIKSELHRAEFI